MSGPDPRAERIDAHQHFWRYQPDRDGWITDEMQVLRRDFLPADLEGVLAASAFNGCIAVQADQSEHETRFLLDLARQHPFIKGVVGWVDLRSPHVEDTLERLADDPLLRGVRHVAQAEADEFLSQDAVIRGVRALARVGLTYDILVYAHQLPATLALTARLPDQPFVVDHLAKPRIRDRVTEPWATQMKELARRPNVCCKVSGLVTQADWRGWQPEDLRPYLDVVFDAFGPDRVMFGSDWPVCLLAGSYERVVHVLEAYAAGFGPDECAALFGGNAVRFYGVHDPCSSS